MHYLMKKSFENCRFEEAKKKAILEEKIETERPPFPVYKKCENIKNNVGWRNFLRELRP